MGAFTQVFVQNTGACSAAAFATPDLVTAGTISFFLAAPYAVATGLDINGPVIGSYDSMQIFHGGKVTASQPIQSPRFLVADIKAVNKAVYAAPVAQVYSIPAGVVAAAGGEAIFTLTQRSNQSEYPHHGFTFTTVFDAGDAYSNTAAIAAVNAASVPITASDGGAGILTLTADVAGEPFDIGLDGILVNLTITQTNEPDPGVNTALHISYLEKYAQGTFGEYYQQTGLLGPRPEDSYTYGPPLFADVDTPGTYDTWTLVVKNDNDTDSIARAFSYAEYVIALEDAVTNEAELDTFFAAIQVSP